MTNLRVGAVAVVAFGLLACSDSEDDTCIPVETDVKIVGGEVCGDDGTDCPPAVYALDDSRPFVDPTSGPCGYLRVTEGNMIRTRTCFWGCTTAESNRRPVGTAEGCHTAAFPPPFDSSSGGDFVVCFDSQESCTTGCAY